MKYSIGKYVVVPPKPFISMEEAVQYIQERFPELGRQSIEKHLTHLVKEDGDNKSRNSSEENTVSQKIDSKDSATSTKGIKSNTDKPG
ncbi:hypothetical protein [Chryseobacterium sp. M5A1_1a]